MNDLHDIIDDYAQKVVDDMDMGDLMASVKQSIIDTLEAKEESEAIAEIKDSVYSDEVLQDYVPTTK